MPSSFFLFFSDEKDHLVAKLLQAALNNIIAHDATHHIDIR
jgi:hypothetical protein